MNKREGWLIDWLIKRRWDFTHSICFFLFSNNLYFWMIEHLENKFLYWRRLQVKEKQYIQCGTLDVKKYVRLREEQQCDHWREPILLRRSWIRQDTRFEALAKGCSLFQEMQDIFVGCAQDAFPRSHEWQQWSYGTTTRKDLRRYFPHNGHSSITSRGDWNQGQRVSRLQWIHDSIHRTSWKSREARERSR